MGPVQQRGSPESSRGGARGRRNVAGHTTAAAAAVVAVSSRARRRRDRQSGHPRERGAACRRRVARHGTWCVARLGASRDSLRRSRPLTRSRMWVWRRWPARVPAERKPNTLTPCPALLCPLRSAAYLARNPDPCCRPPCACCVSPPPSMVPDGHGRREHGRSSPPGRREAGMREEKRKKGRRKDPAPPPPAEPSDILCSGLARHRVQPHRPHALSHSHALSQAQTRPYRHTPRQMLVWRQSSKQVIRSAHVVTRGFISASTRVAP